MSGVLALLAAALALAGALQALAGLWAVRRLAARAAAPPPPASDAPAVSVLKPLHGDEPGLYEALLATLRQDYPGPVQVVFGVCDPADPAAAVARRAVAAVPGADAVLVAGPGPAGANRKVSNLAHLRPAARHPVLVVADSDMHVPPDWLRRVVATLEAPGVGLATCLYRGAARGGAWSRLGAAGVDWGFLPAAALGEALGLARGCYGATMALPAAVLERAGGFEAFLDLLADDHALGEAVRAQGLRVAVAPCLPGHAGVEGSAGALLAHELRWARTVRLVRPGGYWGMALSHPVAFGALAWALSPGLWPVALAAAAARLALAAGVDRALDGRAGPGRLGLLPAREALGCGVFLAGLWPGRVSWRGERYRTARDGAMRLAMEHGPGNPRP